MKIENVEYLDISSPIYSRSKENTLSTVRDRKEGMTTETSRTNQRYKENDITIKDI